MEDKIKNILKQLRLNESAISTLLGIAVVIVIGVLLYNYFSSQPTTVLPELDLELEEATPEPVKPGEVTEGETPKSLPQTHQVAPGDHLWSIAETYFGSGYNWVDIDAVNELENPDLLAEGMELAIPNVPARLQTISSASGAIKLSPSGGDTYYTVQSSDSLWTIAVRAYGDGYQWIKIYEENQQEIGPNPDLIETGMALTIPRN